MSTDLVTLKTRSSLAQRNTLTPSCGMLVVRIRIISITLNTTTNASNRLNMELKYFRSPRPYILMNISMVNRVTNV